MGNLNGSLPNCRTSQNSVQHSCSHAASGTCMMLQDLFTLSAMKDDMSTVLRICGVGGPVVCLDGGTQKRLCCGVECCCSQAGTTNSGGGKRTARKCSLGLAGRLGIVPILICGHGRHSAALFHLPRHGALGHCWALGGANWRHVRRCC